MDQNSGDGAQSCASNLLQALFFLPIGPVDAKRACWTVRSIRTHCTNYIIHILLDGPDSSALPAELSGPDIVCHVRTPPTGGHWGRILRMQCDAMCAALDSPNLGSNAVFVKIDADALVVQSGLAERAQALFLTRPSAGQIGQCYTNVRGGRLKNAGWKNFFDKAKGWRGLRDFVRVANKMQFDHRAAYRAHRQFRELISRAEATGWGLGEFALGGSYILRRGVIEALRGSDFLKSPMLDLIPTVGEDVLMSPLVYAVGFTAIDDVADGGLFGVEGKQFRVDPFVLKSRGHYIIHPTKYGHHADGRELGEEQLVEALG